VSLILTASTLLTPLEVVDQPGILIADGRIVQAGPRDAIAVPAGAEVRDFPGAVLAPGFVDIHIHGGAGYDVMHASADELAQIERHLAAHGVTSYFPTTVTAPLDDTFVALERLAAAVETAGARLARTGDPGHTSSGDLRAQPLGIHLEGPFLSHAKRGVHPPEYLQEPSLEIFDRLWQAARGNVSLMTVAPELPNADWLIAEAARRGVCISLGHSDATYEQALGGIAAGGRHATHTFNAMRALDHRNPGILGAVLGDDRLTADIIADGIHVHPSVVKAFVEAKGDDRAVLITDALSATGMGDGRFQLGPFEVEVRGQRCEHNGVLAGSVLTLDRAVRNIMAFAGWPLARALRLATINPARVSGVDARKGVIAAGADADIVVLNPAGEVIQTIVRGQGV
jgi:N-acetylglucosamine-6-phosphate deacetylase